MNRCACPNGGAVTASDRSAVRCTGRTTRDDRSWLFFPCRAVLFLGLLAIAATGCETLNLTSSSKPAPPAASAETPPPSTNAAPSVSFESVFGPRVKHTDVTATTPPAPAPVLPGDVTVQAKPALVTPKATPETAPVAVSAAPARALVITPAPSQTPRPAPTAAPRPAPATVAVAHSATQLVKSQPEPHVAIAPPVMVGQPESIVLTGPQSENTRKARLGNSPFHLKWLMWLLFGVVGLAVASLSLAAVRGRIVEFIEVRFQKAQKGPSSKPGKFVIKLPVATTPSSITDTVLEDS